ncbi:hypothetical protein ACTXT7_001379 [Hymenolepis weldensis]
MDPLLIILVKFNSTIFAALITNKKHSSLLMSQLPDVQGQLSLKPTLNHLTVTLTNNTHLV